MAEPGATGCRDQLRDASVRPMRKDGIVVALSDDDPAGSDPWRMLAEGRGILVTWGDPENRTQRHWNSALTGTSELARQLSAIVGRAGASMPRTAETLFRLELPTGASLQNLVPAVGGGFRGMVRSNDSSLITGQARLVAVKQAAPKVGLSLGPLVGLMALSVGAEVLAKRQSDKKLDAIVSGVSRLNQEVVERRGAELRGAATAIELASASILDSVDIPETIALGPACHSIRTVKEQSLGWLTEWEDRSSSLPTAGRVSFDRMREVIAGPGSGDEYLDFPGRVTTLYRALVLDSRALVLTEILAMMKRPDASLTQLQRTLAKALGENATAQDRLRSVLWRLAQPPVHTQRAFQMPATDRAADQMARGISALAASLSAEPAAPALLSSQGRQVLEVVRSTSGEIKVLDVPKD